MLPRWRLWSYRRVANPLSLKHKAIGATLTWQDGSIFARSEIKSRTHTALEAELERRALKDFGEYRPPVAIRSDPEDRVRFSLLFMLVLVIPIAALVLRDRIMGEAVSAQLNIALFIIGNTGIAVPFLDNWLQSDAPGWYSCFRIVSVPIGVICLVIVDYPLLWALWPIGLRLLVIAFVVWIVIRYLARR